MKEMTEKGRAMQTVSQQQKFEEIWLDGLLFTWNFILQLFHSPSLSLPPFSLVYCLSIHASHSPALNYICVIMTSFDQPYSFCCIAFMDINSSDIGCSSRMFCNAFDCMSFINVIIIFFTSKIEMTIYKKKWRKAFVVVNSHQSIHYVHFICSHNVIMHYA